jgi:hypothetical protein
MKVHDVDGDAFLELVAGIPGLDLADVHLGPIEKISFRHGAGGQGPAAMDASNLDGSE